ncbi:Carbohydrate-selective porin OprB [Methylorubrum populi BJ001]|uniref:Carbohydrate-selective porin OprB n=1 Tax=Methylorubrum populi (strain ATCC BAA-705 / NCIMB 13946 / BJ001) TaxID=441620 RepID=B1ZKE3_METPB|nr:carbohydrate porin [Methylorubrum populi]ACB80135.1 Carbohydrate-selective porin OprB [Methylorubrum populi BJ001]OAH17129.1 porin [Methylorubrum populi]PZP68488.1 MAG: porin [Methylorubrum populi]
MFEARKRAIGERRAVSVGLAALLGFHAGAAAATDLAERARPRFLDWSGLYAGVQGSAGASFGNYDIGPTTIGTRRVRTISTGDATGSRDLGGDATTVAAGAFAGWNWQDGAIVYGLEADLAGTNLKRGARSDAPGFGYEAVDPPFALVREKTDLFGAARARLGYAFGNNLIYATFGLTGANGRVLATYPDLSGGPTATAARNVSYLGYTLGAGVQFAVDPHLSLGIDYRYSDLGESARFGLGTLPGADGGPVTTRTGFVSNKMMARLIWHPEALALVPDEEDEPPKDARFSLHGQTTFVNQGVTGFRAPYRGPQSLVPDQAQATTTATLFLGLKLFEGTELYYNPEFSQGFGLSRTLGVAGFVNGEAQKAGAPFPKLRSNRYFVRQTFGLGGETEAVPDGPNSIAGTRDVERITVIAGKFALGDFFDGNAYAHDPRVDFMNWGLWASAAWDFPANLPGFTQGVMVEYNRADFAVRAAYTQVPKEPSSDVLDPRVFERAGAVIEFEERHTLPLLDQPGRLRLGLFSNVGNTANFRQVVALTQSGDFADINTAAAATREPRRKSGAYLNLEQALTADLGLFARASVNDGRNESLSFTDIDGSVSGGLSLKGTAWGRPQDTIGFGAAANRVSPSHRAYFANGGLGLLIGDGRLDRYAPERAVEVYYALNLTKAVTMSFDYQHVENPAYNRDRGPADFIGTRLHTDF